MALFKTARLKIKRANEHIADFNRQIADLRSPERQCITREINPQTGDQFLHYDFKSPLPLDDLALVIGDAVHNLKTAIDHGWHTLLSAFVPALAKKSSFPVDISKHQLESRLRGVEIHTICPNLFRFVVQDLSPYSEGGNSVLCAIHYLDIRDKHKLLVPLARVTAVVDAVLENEAGHTTKGATWGTISEALPITIPISAKTKIKVKEYGCLAFEVILDQRSGVHTLSVSDTLHTFSEVTLKTIELMEDFFARTD
jgi:hypothetical protein